MSARHNRKRLPKDPPVPAGYLRWERMGWGGYKTKRSPAPWAHVTRQPDGEIEGWFVFGAGKGSPRGLAHCYYLVAVQTPKLDPLVKAARDLLDLYLANEGCGRDEFISCTTDVDPRHPSKYWRAWNKLRVLTNRRIAKAKASADS